MTVEAVDTDDIGSGKSETVEGVDSDDVGSGDSEDVEAVDSDNVGSDDSETVEAVKILHSDEIAVFSISGAKEIESIHESFEKVRVYNELGNDHNISSLNINDTDGGNYIAANDGDSLKSLSILDLDDGGTTIDDEVKDLSSDLRPGNKNIISNVVDGIIVNETIQFQIDGNKNLENIAMKYIENNSSYPDQKSQIFDMTENPDLVPID